MPAFGCRQAHPHLVVVMRLAADIHGDPAQWMCRTAQLEASDSDPSSAASDYDLVAALRPARFRRTGFRRTGFRRTGLRMWARGAVRGGRKDMAAARRPGLVEITHAPKAMRGTSRANRDAGRLGLDHWSLPVGPNVIFQPFAQVASLGVMPSAARTAALAIPLPPGRGGMAGYHPVCRHLTGTYVCVIRLGSCTPRVLGNNNK